MKRIWQAVALTTVLVFVAGGGALAAGVDRFELTVGPGALTIDHIDAEYNCCLESIDYESVRSSYQLHVTESENLGDLGCWCLCLYATRVRIDDLEPGLWDIDFDYWDGGEATEHWQVEIPEATESGDSKGVEVWWSDCGGTPNDTVAWAALKLMYR